MENLLEKIVKIEDFSKFRKKIIEFELSNRIYSKQNAFKKYILSLIQGGVYSNQKIRFFITNRIFTKTEAMQVLPFLIKNDDFENLKAIKLSFKDYELKNALYLSVQCIQDIESNGESIGQKTYSLICEYIKELSKENNIFWWNDFFRNKDFNKEDIFYYFNKKFDFNINMKAFSNLLGKFLQNNLIIESYKNRVIEENNISELESELKIFIQLYIDLPESFRNSYRNKNIVKVFDKMIKRELFLMDCKD